MSDFLQQKIFSAKETESKEAAKPSESATNAAVSSANAKDKTQPAKTSKDTKTAAKGNNN